MIKYIIITSLCIPHIIYAIPPLIKPSVKTNNLTINQRSGDNRFRDNNGRLLRNHKYAGKTIFLKNIAPKLAHKYKKPIHFNKYGYPDFSKYSKMNIQTSKLTGIHHKDIKIIEKIVKKKYPKWRKRIGYTWHHHQDGKTMQYIPTDLHSAIPHSGGASRLRIKNN